jgi:hypothetical protein
MTSREEFSKVYESGLWGQSVIPGIRGGSGDGSNPIHAEPYMRCLQKFLKDREIKSVTDLGSGDWQFSRFVDWTGINYIGIDCVPAVLAAVSKQYRSDNVKFICMDFMTNVDHIPKADLCVIKDVLQHWPSENVRSWLQTVIEKKLFKYILITNCVHQPRQDRGCPLGDYVPLSPDMTPLNEFKSEVLLAYDTKKTSLITIDQ